MSRFVLRDVDGPEDLVARTPLTATTIACLPDASGDGEFWCASLDEAVKYRLPADFDRRRCQPEFLGADDDGEFLWTTVIVVWTGDPSRRLHRGMLDLEVTVGYVVDQTLGGDAVLDPEKIDVVATGSLDDDEAPAPWPANPAATEEEPADLGVGEFNLRLNLAVAKLAALTGIHPGAGVPVEASTDDLSSVGRAGYDLSGPEGPRYRRRDLRAGWQTIATGSLEELLYRAVDDVARDLAWRWSEGAPVAAEGMSAHLRADLATGYWRLLVAALDPVWGVRTADAIGAAGGFGSHRHRRTGGR